MFIDLNCFLRWAMWPMGLLFLLFVRLFAWCFTAHSRIFHSYGDVIITCEGLQSLTYTRHSWTLSNRGSLVCNTHCDTGNPFIMVTSEDPWHLEIITYVSTYVHLSFLLFPSVWHWSCHNLLLRLRSVAAGIRTPNLLHASQYPTVPTRRFLSFRNNYILV